MCYSPRSYDKKSCVTSYLNTTYFKLLLKKRDKRSVYKELPAKKFFKLRKESSVSVYTQLCPKSFFSMLIFHNESNEERPIDHNAVETEMDLFCLVWTSIGQGTLWDFFFVYFSHFFSYNLK